MRIRCWVRAISSRWTELTSSSRSRARSRSRSRDRHAAPARARRGPARRGYARRRRGIDSSSRASTTATATPTACADAPLAAAAAHAARSRAHAPRARPRGRSRESARPCRARARSSVVAEREPGVHLGRSGGPGRLGQPLALGGVGLLVRRRRAAAARRASRSASPSRSWSRASWAAAIAWSRRSASARASALRAVVAELLGDRGEGRVGLVQLGQRHVDPALGVERARARGWRRRSRAARGCARRVLELLGGVVDRGLHLDQARLAGGAAGGEVGAQEVALAGDRRQGLQRARPT